MNTNIKLLTWLAVFVGVLSESHFHDPQSQPLQALSGSYRSHKKKSSQSSRPTLKTKDLWHYPQVLCVVFVDPDNTNEEHHYDNALIVKETWGRHCNDLIFYSKKADKYLSSVVLPDIDKYGNVYSAFHMNSWDIQDRLNEFDWIYFGSDVIYTVVENLKYYLLRHDPSKKLIWGFHYKNSKEKKRSVLSVMQGFAVTTAAFPVITASGGLEECQKSVARGMFSMPCLEEGGVNIVDFRDELGRHSVTNGNAGQYLKTYTLSENEILDVEYEYNLPKGPDCCADVFVGGYLQHTNTAYMLDFMSHDFPFPDRSCDRDVGWTMELNNTDDPLPGKREMINNTVLDEANQTSNTSHEYKILCLVNTTKEFHQINDMDIKNTWGKRCSKLSFISDIDDAILPSVNLEDSGSPWFKLKQTLFFAYQFGKQFGLDFDWLLFTGHDKYVFFKNLVPLLQKHDPSQKLAFGCRLKSRKLSHGYLPFECGIVLSKAAVIAFVKEAMNIHRCKKGNLDEMAETFSRCLQDVGVEFVDTRDSFGRHTFLPSSMEYFFSKSVMEYTLGDWWLNNTFYPHSFGENCCSRKIISVGWAYNYDLYLLDFLETRFKLMKAS